MRPDPAIVVWLIWLAVCVVLATFVPIWWNRKRRTYDRTADHIALANALTDWLQQKKIVQAVIESGIYSGKQVQFTFEAVPFMTEGQLRTAAATILKDRIVMRVIASYMEKEHGTDPETVRAALLVWSKAA